MGDQFEVGDQSQGGLLPSWQTTVVPEFGGTTTVVFCGGGGLLLLMHADSSGMTHSETNNAFIAWILTGYVTGTLVSRIRLGTAVIRTRELP